MKSFAMENSGDPLQSARHSVNESVVSRKTLLKEYADDRMVHVCMAVAAETAVLADRLDRLEKVLTARGQVQPDELDWTELSAEHADQRLRWHEAFAERILRVITQDLEVLRGRDAGGEPRRLSELG
jgi:hypothetical protein